MIALVAKQTCTVCGERYPQDAPMCPRCGYQPRMAPGALSNIPTPVADESDPGSPFPDPVAPTSPFPDQGYGTPTPITVGTDFNVVRKLISLLALGAIVGGGFIAYRAADSAVRSVRGQLPSITSTAGGNFGFDDPTNMSPERCVAQMRKYMKRLFFDLAEGKSNDLSAGFIEASNVFGPGSDNYTAFVNIFSEQKLSSAAALGQPGKAYRMSLPLIDKACKA
jgi:hypothetical protein